MSWENKKVLVTGAGGFIGSHLTEKLVELGADVRAMVFYNSNNNWEWIDTFPKNLKNKLEIFPGDVRDPYCAKKAIEGVEICFHLAALIAIPYSYMAPASYVQTNVLGTLNMLQAGLDSRVKKFIHTSTSEVYGTARYTPIDERHPLKGQSPYSASKIGADMLAVSFCCSFGTPVSIIRPFNTFGPRQSARAVISTILSQCLSRKNKIKLGSLSPTRDFTYVKDVVEGFIKAAESSRSVGEIINLGSKFEISIADLVEKISKLLRKKITIKKEHKRIRPDKSEVERLLSDNTKAKKILGWEPIYDFDQGLKETIDWFKKNLHYYKTDIYNI